MDRTRRNFLGIMLAACAAPAIVRASSLMPIVARRKTPFPYPGEWGTIEGITIISDHCIAAGVVNLNEAPPPWPNNSRENMYQIIHEDGSRLLRADRPRKVRIRHLTESVFHSFNL